jgi:hypothetical protein
MVIRFVLLCHSAAPACPAVRCHLPLQLTLCICYAGICTLANNLLVSCTCPAAVTASMSSYLVPLAVAAAHLHLLCISLAIHLLLSRLDLHSMQRSPEQSPTAVGASMSSCLVPLAVAAGRLHLLLVGNPWRCHGHADM